MTANNINDQDFEDQVAGQDDAAYDEAYNETDTYTDDDAEEWADGDDEGSAEGEEQAPPKKKKSSTLTVIIILVVAIVGVLGFMVVTGGNAPAPQQAQQTAPVAIDADPDQPVADTTAQVPASTFNGTSPEQGMLDNPSALKEDTNTEAAAPTLAEPTANQPVVANDAPPVPTLGEGTPADTSKDVVAAISPSVKPVSDFPTVDSIKKPDTASPSGIQGTAAPVTPVDQAQPTEVLPVPADTIPMDQASMTAPAPQAVVPAVDTAKLAEIQSQLTAAQTKISQLEKNLSDKSAELATEKAKVAEPVSMASNDAEVDELKSKVADLEEKLAQKKAKAVTAVPERTPVRSYDDSEAETAVAAQPAPVKKAAVLKAKPAKQNWSLKGASSGKAILSDKSTGDMKTVHVGDTVSGLGRIVSISNATSAWVVKGTLGSVTE